MTVGKGIKYEEIMTLKEVKNKKELIMKDASLLKVTVLF